MKDTDTISESLRAKMKHCAGCHDDHYNQPGNSNCGHCWSLEDAKLILRKEVSIDQRPPWNQKPRKFYNCYHRQRFVYVGPTITN